MLANSLQQDDFWLEVTHDPFSGFSLSGVTAPRDTVLAPSRIHSRSETTPQQSRPEDLDQVSSDTPDHHVVPPLVRIPGHVGLRK